MANETNGHPMGTLDFEAIEMLKIVRHEMLKCGIDAKLTDLICRESAFVYAVNSATEYKSCSDQIIAAIGRAEAVR